MQHSSFLFFYVRSLFKTYAIITLHNFLCFVAAPRRLFQRIKLITDYLREKKLERIMNQIPLPTREATPLYLFFFFFFIANFLATFAYPNSPLVHSSTTSVSTPLLLSSPPYLATYLPNDNKLEAIDAPLAWA